MIWKILGYISAGATGLCIGFFIKEWWQVLITIFTMAFWMLCNSITKNNETRDKK